MADILKIGMSGLSAYKNAISLTSHNINNANTEGYSRRTVSFTERASSLFGSGVDSTKPERVFDQLTIANMRTSQSAFNKNDAYLNSALQYESFVGNEAVSISRGLTDVFDSLQNVNSNPSSVENRNQYLTNLENIATRMQIINREVESQFESTNRQVGVIADSATSLAKELAQLNSDITNPLNAGNIGLADQRDQILQSLSGYVDLTIVPQNDGAINVFIGSGSPLVVGSTANQLTTSQNQDDIRKVNLNMVTSGGVIKLEDNVSGGLIGGIYEYQNDMLEPSLTQINRVAMAISDAYNKQHKLGVDIEGNLGGNILNDINSATAQSNRVVPFGANIGSADLSVQIDDVNQLNASNYQLQFSSATDYTVTRKSDNANVATGTLGGLPSTVTLDGFTLNFNSGTFSAGDQFTVSPTANGAKDFNVVITNPSKVAIGSPIIGSIGMQNSGSGYIASTSVTDTSTTLFSTPGQLSPPLRVEFLSSTQYQLVNATDSSVIEGPLTYDPTMNNDIFPTAGSYDPGIRVTLTGDIDANDVFNIDYSANGLGDNRNGILLGNVHAQGVLENGAYTMSEGFNSFLSDVSLKVHSSQISHESSNLILSNAIEQRDSVSGVNIEEEAINLMRYEQAFQANAQVIEVGNTLLDILLGLGR